MADQTLSNPSASREQVNLDTSFPEGNRTEKQREILDTTHAHLRREAQENSLLLQEAISLQSTQGAQTAPMGTGPSAALKGTVRSADQNTQLNQQEELSGKVHKRGKGKRGGDDSTLRQLSSLVGPEAAEDVLTAIEQASQKHGSGLTVNPSDLKQLAKELSTALKGNGALTTLGVSASSETARESELLSILTRISCAHSGAVSARQIAEDLTTLSSGRKLDFDPPASELEDISIQIKSIIRDNQSAPIERLLKLRSSVKDSRDLHAAITRYEIEHECCVLDTALGRYEQLEEVYSRQIDLFIDNLIPAEQRECYAKSFLSHATERHNIDYNQLLDRRAELLEVIQQRVANLEEERTATLSYLHDAEVTLGCSLVTGELLSRYKSLSVKEQNFAQVHEQLVLCLRSEIEKEIQLKQLRAESEEAQKLSLIIDATAQSIATVSEQHRLLLEAIASERSLAEKIGGFWSRFSLLYKRGFERSGITPPQAHFYHPEADSYFNQVTPFASSEGKKPEHYNDFHQLKELEKSDDSRGEGSSTAHSSKDEKTNFELREEADREARISVETAQHFALSGDFMNAEAAITNYNNRFPDFQISRDFISRLREEVSKRNAETSVSAA